MQEMEETWVRSLGREDPLEEEMATYSSIFAWRIPGTGEPVELPSMGSQRIGRDCATSLSLPLFLEKSSILINYISFIFLAAFSSWDEWELLPSCSVWASLCSGFS